MPRARRGRAVGATLLVPSGSRRLPLESAAMCAPVSWTRQWEPLSVDALRCASGLLGLVHGLICSRDEFVRGDFVVCPGESEGCS